MDKPIVTIGPLSGPDGNAFVLMGACRQALRDAGRKGEWEGIQHEMMAGDYENLLNVMDKYFTVYSQAVMTEQWRST